MLHRLLAHPLTRGKDIDSPETTNLRRAIIKSKPFLLKIYKEWYAEIAAEMAQVHSSYPVLELGSGAGFLTERLPNLITSEVFLLQGMQIVLDAQHLPFTAGSLKGIAMTNVLHHIPEPALFFEEAQRCVASGGKIVMIEPWLTAWSQFVYKNLHHEPVDEANTSWKIDGKGPLSSANTALPWILFKRDRGKFVAQFPEWEIREVKPFMAFLYLVSGGISLRSLMPSWTFGFWRVLEALLSPLRHQLGMFAKIVLVHRSI